MTTTTTECIDLAIIGGGPAGIAAALAAADVGIRPVLLDDRKRLAETIRPTGDGRCNISNATVDAWDYHNADFVRRAFLEFRPTDVHEFLQSCGIMLREESEGRLYPLPNKSTAVIEALLAALGRSKVKSRVGKRVDLIRRNTDMWTIAFEDGSRLRSKSVIVCTGGTLRPDFFPKSVAIVPSQPILAPLACDPRPIRGLDKLRAKCALHFEDVTEKGEITFRTYGISGICAFNLSRLVRPGDDISIDFAPDLPRSQTIPFLEERLETLRPASWMRFTTGMLLPQIATAVLRSADLEKSARPRREDLVAFEEAWHRFPLKVTGIGDPKLAQVHRGGVDTSCLDPHTLAVSDEKGLYVAGEVVDVDGPCGGYNLHWAWASGSIAGRAAAEDLLPLPKGKHVLEKSE